MSFLCYSFYGFFLPTLCLFRGRWRCGWSRACLWQIFLYFTKSILSNACLKWLDYMKMKSFGIAYSCISKSYSHWKFLVCSYIYLEWYELQRCNLNSRVTSLLLHDGSLYLPLIDIPKQSPIEPPTTPMSPKMSYNKYSSSIFFFSGGL